MTASMLPIRRPILRAPDVEAKLFENVDLAIYDVFVATLKSGGLIQGRTFRGCRIQGPGILLISSGVTFKDTNFGDSHGSIANLVVRPAGEKAIGTMPVRDCHFEGCEFYSIGFTGDDAFLNQVLAMDIARAPGGNA